MSRNGSSRKPANPLTDKQREVVRFCALGCTCKEIARILEIKKSTVENHRARAMARIGAVNAAMLTRYAIEQRISPLGDCLTAEELVKAAGAEPPVAEGDQAALETDDSPVGGV